MSNLSSIQLLQKLIEFDTTSHKSNLALISYVKNLLESKGISIFLNSNAEQTKANLFATIGPKDRAGILLSGHTDVVPVEGQAWSSNPFQALIKDHKIYGRGTADMKGFIACAIHAMIKAVDLPQLNKPLHLCLSYDEEIGCIGVRGILGLLSEYIIQPELCIIGEPTSMNIATGHKGKAVFKAICHGQEGHSALAPLYVNAIHNAQSLIEAIRTTQKEIAEGSILDTDYDVPFSTVHIGKIHGGKALNIVPNECILDYEIRNIAEQTTDAIQEKIFNYIEQSPSAKFVNIQEINQYPGLDTSTTIQAVKFLQSLLKPETELQKISFGTEGGLFQQQLNTAVLVCGPGSIQVAHKPDEYIEISQMDECDAFFERLLNHIAA
ncbi:acetylornithine deacetylase [Acinetobacter bereziniae]|uniref:acetylornithine deacetylase n=1 Tax=Acinetobacter bereziniae TaxID=106648 RepID=UPI00125EC728|nr:acetylornithine deacetylase [Acinetobacter bereziniae]